MSFHRVSRLTAAATFGAVLAVTGAVVLTQDAQEIRSAATVPPSPVPLPDTRTMTMEPRSDVLTASALSTSWDGRSVGFQELFCVEWFDRASDVIATLAANATELGQAFDAPTAVDFLDYACEDLFSGYEVGTGVSRDRK